MNQRTPFVSALLCHPAPRFARVLCVSLSPRCLLRLAMAVAPEILKAFVKKDGVQNRLITIIEPESLPDEETRALYPDLSEHWKRAGNALSVPCRWVMLCELSLAAVLAPTAVLRPTTTLSIPAFIRSILLARFFGFLRRLCKPGKTYFATRSYGHTITDAGIFGCLVEADANAIRSNASAQWQPPADKGKGLCVRS